MKEKLLVIGAGLCGSMLAMRLADLGYQVEVHERRADMRRMDVDSGRSINLALSDRGLRALRMIGMEEEIQKICIPMHGRLIHPVQGENYLSKYSGREGEYINSVSRRDLNEALINKADEYDNLHLYFNSKCVQVDLENGRASFEMEEGKGLINVEADIIIGADGAGSSLRRSMKENADALSFENSEEFLSHGYKELEIPPGPNGTYRIEKNALHIWPRGSHMLIALPNLDGSFTVTLFLSYKDDPGFDDLDTDEKILNYFQSYYPDVIPHMPDLLEDYKDNPTGRLGTVKCFPWQAYEKCLLIGDAAHAIVPFYGQGMNAAFEDVFMLDKIIQVHQGDWPAILKTYQETRKVDTDAIADLAIDNFHEMQNKTADPVFVKKRKLEMRLEKEMSNYHSKYSLVTFNENIPYAEAMRRGRRQDELLMGICEQVEEEGWSLERVMEYLEENSLPTTAS